MCVKGKEGKYRDYLFLACEGKRVKPVVRFSILQQVSCTYPQWLYLYPWVFVYLGSGRGVKGKNREREEGSRVE